MEDNEFNSYLNTQVNYYGINDPLAIAEIIHEKYKDKYSFVDYTCKTWQLNSNPNMPSNDVIEELNKDIQILGDLLEQNENALIREIVDKFKDEHFMKNVIYHMRELSYHYYYETRIRGRIFS